MDTERGLGSGADWITGAGLSTQDRNTAMGGGAGAVGGAVLTDGSAIGTVVGAVVASVIGHEVSTGKK